MLPSVQTSTPSARWNLNCLPSIKTTLISLKNKIVSIWQSLASHFAPKPPANRKVSFSASKDMTPPSCCSSKIPRASLKPAEAEGLSPPTLPSMPSTTEDTLLAAAPGQQSMPTVPQQAPVTTVRSEPSAPQSALDTFNNRAEALVSLFISAVGW